MIFAKKIALKLSKEEEMVLDGQSKILNWLYNHLLETANTLKTQYLQTQDPSLPKILYTKRGLRDLLPSLKEEFPFLKSVYSSPLKNAALRLSESIQAYQKSRQGKRNGKKTGWPKFQKWKRKWFSLKYEEPFKGYSLEGRRLTLQLGVDADSRRLSLEGELAESFPKAEYPFIKTLSVKKENGLYYALFTLEKDDIQKLNKENNRILAIDPNHKNLGYGVSNEGEALELLNFKPMKKLEKRIDELKSRRDRCVRKAKLVRWKREDGSEHKHYEPSRRWTFFNQKLEEVYRIRREQTKTYLNTLSNQLFKNYDIVGIGDYTPNGGGISKPMRRAMNNQSLIGEFKKTLSWVAVRSNKTYVEYPEKGTTRTCHLQRCGYLVEAGLSPEIRSWRCPECNTFHERDENAAQNGLKRVCEMFLVPRSGHTEVEIRQRWAWKVLPSGVRRILRGQDGFLNEDTFKKLKQEQASS